MFRAEQTGEALELSDEGARSAIAVLPARGAIVTRFRAGDRDVLYLDPATLTDRTKNVRGGIPVLFPSPGRLTGDRFERGGKSGAMKQHGFARDLPWTVEALSTERAARATLSLESNDATRAVFPWEFRVEITYTLRGSRLRLDVTVVNMDKDTMPLSFGIHPYFLVRDKAAVRIATRATRAFDNVTKKIVAFEGFDLAGSEVDLHLIDHGSSESALTWGDGARAVLRASPELVRWVVWTVPGRDFVCLEPWTAPADALNTGESLLEIAPAGRRDLWIQIDVTGATT